MHTRWLPHQAQALPQQSVRTIHVPTYVVHLVTLHPVVEMTQDCDEHSHPIKRTQRQSLLLRNTPRVLGDTCPIRFHARTFCTGHKTTFRIKAERPEVRVPPFPRVPLPLNAVTVLIQRILHLAVLHPRIGFPPHASQGPRALGPTLLYSLVDTAVCGNPQRKCPPNLSLQSTIHNLSLPYGRKLARAAPLLLRRDRSPSMSLPGYHKPSS
ncbi:hypothetical protein PWT90_11256 [Aphanocladium album]|nr:hypothetical protein PWT90_11256 [Aphanocladium album]